MLFQELDNSLTWELYCSGVIHWMEGPKLVFEECLVDDAVFDLVLLVVG